MDDLFGVTELAKKIEDEEGAHDIPPAKDFEGEKTQHVEISQVSSNTKHWGVPYQFCDEEDVDGSEWVMILDTGFVLRVT